MPRTHPASMLILLLLAGCIELGGDAAPSSWEWPAGHYGVVAVNVQTGGASDVTISLGAAAREPGGPSYRLIDVRGHPGDGVPWLESTSHLRIWIAGCSDIAWIEELQDDHVMAASNHWRPSIPAFFLVNGSADLQDDQTVVRGYGERYDAAPRGPAIDFVQVRSEKGTERAGAQYSLLDQGRFPREVSAMSLAGRFELTVDAPEGNEAWPCGTATRPPEATVPLGSWGPRAGAVLTPSRTQALDDANASMHLLAFQELRTNGQARLVDYEFLATDEGPRWTLGFGIPGESSMVSVRCLYPVADAPACQEEQQSGMDILAPGRESIDPRALQALAPSALCHLRFELNEHVPTATARTCDGEAMIRGGDAHSSHLVIERGAAD